VRTTIEKHLSDYRYFEVWLDYIKDIEHDFVSSLVSQYPSRLIFVFRRQNFEKETMQLSLREKILASLSNKEALVDFDIARQTGTIEEIRRKGLALSTILSYHDYQQTPTDTELESIVSRAKDMGAYITKLSVFCSTQRDALRLLSLLLQLREAGRRCIVLGMGEHGVITRIFGPLWGNELSFVPVEVAESSAPGQISLDKLKTIMQALE
jgi:3-dehydroquinate dehydratase type I